LLAHRVVVLLRGKVVESGPTLAVFRAPRHRYTQMLLASIPVVTLEEQQTRPPWPWDRSTAPDMAATGHGCPFRPRCPYAVAACATDEPDLTLLAPEHSARCHNPASPEAPL
jgi:peptide/nickel transport system ATP-binding protein/oligopeptide transport system ATP-binding protein